MAQTNRLGKAVEAIGSQRQQVDFAQLGPEDIKQNHKVFRFLNDKDRDILYLIFLLKKKQPSVYKILGRSQPSLVYDIKRIKDRIKFIVYLREVFDLFVDFLQTNLSDYSKETAQVLILMYFTTSYTLTSKVLKMRQIYVRHLFEKALRDMADNKHWAMYEIFNVIRHNKNVVRRTYVYKNTGHRASPAA